MHLQAAQRNYTTAIIKLLNPEMRDQFIFFKHFKAFSRDENEIPLWLLTTHNISVLFHIQCSSL